MQIPDYDMVVDNYDNGQDNSDRADVVLVSPSGSLGSPEEPESLRADDCKPSFAHLFEIRSIQAVWVGAGSCRVPLLWTCVAEIVAQYRRQSDLTTAMANIIHLRS